MTAAPVLDRPAPLAGVGRLTVAYCRISSDREGAGLGVAAQESAIRARAAQMGMPVDVVITDNDVSAHDRRKVRPGYADLLDMIGDGRVGVVFVWHTDRLHRQNRELEPFIDLVVAHGVTIQTVQSGPLDLTSPNGQLNARIAGAIAQHESAHKSERLKLMHARKAEGGQFHGGRRRFGYTADMSAIVDVEADAIRDAAARVLAGESLRSITARWNADGLPTPTGKEWRSPNVGKLLRSAHLAGIRTHNGEATAATWPAIFDADTHESLVRFLGNPDRVVSGFSGVRKHALSGLLRCGVCDGVMYGRETRATYGPAYICRGGQHVHAPVRDVDLVVRDVVVERLARVDASGVFLAPVDAEAANARAAERLALTDNRRATVADVLLAPADKAAALAAIDARLAELDAAAQSEDDAARLPLRVLDGLTGVPADVVGERFDALPFDRRRAVVAVLGTPVLARASRKGRGLKWEPERVGMRWNDALA